MSARFKDFRLFFYYFQKYKRFYLYGVASLMVVDVLDVVPPILLKWAVDLIDSKQVTQFKLLQICGCYLLVVVCQGIGRFFWRKYIIKTSMYASDDLRKLLFFKLTTLTPRFFKKSRTGELVSLSTNDIESVRFSLGPGSLTLFDALFYFITIPPVMFYLSWKLTLICYIPLLLLPKIVAVIERRIRQSFTLVQERFSDLASSCQESLAGIRIIKGNALEKATEHNFSKLGHKYIRSNYTSAWDQSSLSTSLEFFVSTSVCLVFLVGGSLVIGQSLSLGVFVAFQRYVQKLNWPMEAIGLTAGIFQRSLASQVRLDTVMNETNELKQESSPHSAFQNPIPALEVRNLTFFYPGQSRPALQNINFTLKPGMKLGLIGAVGAGKSTLLQCLSRMDTVESESILWDNVDVNLISLADARAASALVSQEVFLFSESIGQNILYGTPLFFEPVSSPARLAAIRAAAEKACVWEDIQRLPEKEHTLLGERGTNLSGGQRQRLTIARALARNPRLLYLDDCMSAIDSETETRLVANLHGDQTTRTLVVSSHRMSIMRHMDWVIELAYGKILRQGRPQDLGLQQ